MAEKPNGGAKPIRISDVAKPGKSAPSASSKPIIVTNRPVLRDPMMAKEEPDDKTSGSSTLPLSHLKIAPLSDESKSDSAEAASTSEPSEAAEPETTIDSKTTDAEMQQDADSEPESPTGPDISTSPKDAVSLEEAKPEPAESTTEKDTDLTGETDEDDAKPNPTAQHAEADQAADEIRAKELDDLAESRKYYLPINQIEKRKAKRYAWAGILLIVLLAVAWADVALDAHLISIPGVKAPTHFFSN